MISRILCHQLKTITVLMFIMSFIFFSLNTKKGSVVFLSDSRSRVKKEQDYAAVWNEKSLLEAGIRTEQQRRKHRLNYMCKQYYSSTTSRDLENSANIADKLRSLNNIFVDKERKILYCSVPKTGCTTMKRMLIESSGRIPQHVLDKETHRGNIQPSQFVHMTDFIVKAALTPLDQIKKTELPHILRTYFKFLVVRNPWTRLLSAYRDKLESTHPDVLYFHKLVGRTIMKRYRKNATAKELTSGTGVKFKEFLQYLADTGNPAKSYHQYLEPMLQHWRNVHALCEPCLVHYDFIGKLETIHEDSERIIRRISKNRTKTSVFPDKHLGPVSRKNETETDSLRRYYEGVSEDTLNKLRDVFASDFDLFGYNKTRPW